MIKPPINRIRYVLSLNIIHDELLHREYYFIGVHVDYTIAYVSIGVFSHSGGLRLILDRHIPTQGVNLKSKVRELTVPLTLTGGYVDSSRLSTLDPKVKSIRMRSRVIQHMRDSTHVLNVPRPYSTSVLYMASSFKDSEIGGM